MSLHWSCECTNNHIHAALWVPKNACFTNMWATLESLKVTFICTCSSPQNSIQLWAGSDRFSSNIGLLSVRFSTGLIRYFRTGTGYDPISDIVKGGTHYFYFNIVWHRRKFWIKLALYYLSIHIDLKQNYVLSPQIQFILNWIAQAFF